MEHDERADELEKDLDRLEHESEKLGESTEQARSDWDSKKSSETGAPGAASPEASGPHNIDEEDPATGRKYGEKRQEEVDALHETESGDAKSEDSDNDST
ncbi:MAG TPA: hypothetical protein VF712_15140 [Thermoleophilaceae bacterium]|jgi:hypothetical protein